MSKHTQILRPQVHARGKPIPRGGNATYTEDALLRQAAEMTIGYSGAELANLLNEAAILMVRLFLLHRALIEVCR